MTESQHLLHLEDVYVRYNSGGEEVTILNDIDLKVSDGEFVTVVGPSGCGKSTLLKLILGSEFPSEGKVHFMNKVIDGPDHNRGIVFQKYSLFPHMSVVDNVAFGLDLKEFGLFSRWLRYPSYRKKKAEYKAEAMAFLQRVGLQQHADKYPHQLSGGMRQRVAIAQSLIMKPRILLMDEPLGALDDSTRQDMQLFLLEQWEAHGITVFFVTHDLEEACFLGSRVLVLSQYYETDKGAANGAKIVADISIPGEHPKPHAFKYSPTMASLVKKIREEGLDPNYCQHIKSFDLSHKDAFRTVHEEEWKKESAEAGTQHER